MKFQRIGVVTAICAAAAIVGCSSDQKGAGEHDSSIAFNLTTSDGVIITSVNYDLNTQAGADVVDGSIPVPNPDSTISLGVESLASGDYSLAFSASGTKGSTTYTCLSSPSLFHLNASQELTLAPITLTCTGTVASGDSTGGIKADVNVTVETITVDSNVVETFSYGPRAVKGVLSGTACVFPPIALKVANNDATVTYGWTSSPDGTLALNATNTSGTYTCASGGTKTLTITGTKGSVSNSKSVTVTCDDSACGSTGTGGAGGMGSGGAAGAGAGGIGAGGAAAGTGGAAAGTGGTSPGPFCGDGIVNQSSEQCDETAARCQNCLIVPVCGDGITDAPEQCDTAGPSATCDASCHTVTAPPACSDTWLSCVNADADLGPVQATYCNAACVAVEKCVVDSDCFSPNAAACYCGFGVDVDLCGTATFVPNQDPTSPAFAPCYNQVRTGENNPATNQAALDLFFDFSVPTGVGTQIVDASQGAGCVISCP